MSGFFQDQVGECGGEGRNIHQIQIRNMKSASGLPIRMVDEEPPASMTGLNGGDGYGVLG